MGREGESGGKEVLTPGCHVQPAWTVLSDLTLPPAHPVPQSPARILCRTEYKPQLREQRLGPRLRERNYFERFPKRDSLRSAPGRGDSLKGNRCFHPIRFFTRMRIHFTSQGICLLSTPTRTVTGSPETPSDLLLVPPRAQWRRETSFAAGLFSSSLPVSVCPSVAVSLSWSLFLSSATLP